MSRLEVTLFTAPPPSSLSEHLSCPRCWVIWGEAKRCVIRCCPEGPELGHRPPPHTHSHSADTPPRPEAGGSGEGPGRVGPSWAWAVPPEGKAGGSRLPSDFPGVILGPRNGVLVTVTPGRQYGVLVEQEGAGQAAETPGASCLQVAWGGEW